MARTQSIAVDIQVTITSGLNGIPYSLFHPNNPFIYGSRIRSLPHLNNLNKFKTESFPYGNEYWVVEEELTMTPPSIDLKKVFNCFNQIPSGGATYKIKLCADVPYNDNPTLLSYNTNSDIGHSFIVITKSNGTKSITQVFGFYAAQHPGYLAPFRPMISVFKNNQLREINASIEQILTEAQFEVIRKKAFELARQKYNAASYNCTNFGLDIFNSVRSNPIITDSYTVYLPNNNNSYGTSDINKLQIEKTPQMLFKKLKEMKDGKGTEACSISIDTTNKTKAPLSHGECD